MKNVYILLSQTMLKTNNSTTTLLFPLSDTAAHAPCFLQHNKLWLLPACPFSTCVTPGISRHLHPEGEPCNRLTYIPSWALLLDFLASQSSLILIFNICFPGFSDLLLVTRHLLKVETWLLLGVNPHLTPRMLSPAKLSKSSGGAPGSGAPGYGRT